MHPAVLFLNETQEGLKSMAKKMGVPFGTIQIPDESVKLVHEILEKKRISSGRYVRQFEQEFAELIGVKEAVAVSSGTDADMLACAVLHDLGAEPDLPSGGVIVPAIPRAPGPLLVDPLSHPASVRCWM